MPEYPDLVVYLEQLSVRILGLPLERIRLASPFVLRSVEPSIQQTQGRRVLGLERIGKRLVIELEGGIFLILHLMISGRLHWKEAGAKIPGKRGLAAFDFSPGTLLLTEASSKKRASLHLVKGRKALQAFDRGGLEVLSANYRSFCQVLARENHTLKRALTDPRLFSGIGNAYSDELLHRARLSPVKLTSQLSSDERKRLYLAARETLSDWAERLRQETGEEFPEKVTAFRDEMAVHGKFRRPCPVCGSAIQRIIHAENETNYCPRCQTGGKLLADRVLSKLLKDDWPRTIEELEEKTTRGPAIGP